jgi:putative transposase
MLNKTTFLQYGQTLDLREEAIEQIQAIRSAEPIRHVQGRGSNVCARYPSQKMGRIIQAESRTVELVAVRCAYEFESAVLEYWDQPCQIDLTYLARNGRQITVKHTPDFFVLRKNGVGWEEWKPETRMRQLAEQMPHRYEQQADGRWRCPPGEAFAAQFGFYYRVRTSAEISPIYQRNVLLLEDYLITPEQRPIPEIQQAIEDVVRAQPGITLQSLQESFTSDDLLSLVATGRLFIDLEAIPLVDSHRVSVFASSEEAEKMVTEAPAHSHEILAHLDQVQPGTVFLWDKRTWQIVNVGQERIALLPDEVEGHLVEVRHAEFEQLVALGRIVLPTPSTSLTYASERIRQASPQTLQRATERLQAVELLLTEQIPETRYSARTLRRYKRRYLEAKTKWGNGFLGLLDDNHKKGNHVSHLTVEAQTQIEQFITGSYETFKQKSVLCVYGEYVLACQEQGIQTVSYQTFSQKVKERPRAEQVLKRQGKRAAYQTGPQNWWLSYDTPQHGDFPWQYTHIDHTLLNLEMVCARTGRNLGRPWLSVLLDAFSRRILALYISFDPPSYRACMSVLVECVHRHQRLPQHIIVDNGPEFRSTYFETILAHYQITKLSRPPAEPRTGSLIERLFRTSETEFVHNLRGNTQMMKLARQVSKEVNPKNQAVWTLECLYEYFCLWAYEVYDQLSHSTLGQSPRDMYLTGLTTMGLRPNRRVADNETFRLLMLPTTRRGRAKVMPGRGVKVNYLYYWCDAFRQPKVERKVVPVRYDPFNAGIAYAYVNGVWERCISERYATFQGHTEREMAIATAALRQQKRLDRQQIIVNAQTLAAFLTSVEGQEVVLEQQLKDKAVQQIRTFMVGTAVNASNLFASAEITSTMNTTPSQRAVSLDDLETYGELTL